MSIWEENVNMPKFKPLEGNVKTDVLIIGGGIFGILCAYKLHQKCVNYILVEAENICNGTTKNTTAKITSQHGLIYNKMVKRFGLEYAKMYLKANNEAIDKYKSLAKEIDCDFEKKSSFLYSVDNKTSLEDEMGALIRMGYPAKFKGETELPFFSVGAIEFEHQAQFNPLKFLAEISKNLNIYENTKINDYKDGKFVFEGGEITAENTIIATHFPFINKHGGYFLKLHQSRSHVVVLENAPNLNGMYMDQNEEGLSLRNYKDFLLFGGGSHRPGKCMDSVEKLKNLAKFYYPNSKIKLIQSAQDCMSLDSIPYIGRYSKKKKRLFTATGFNKWGMTSSMVAAEIITDMIMEKDNEYAPIFTPSRSILRTDLFSNAFESVLGLITPSARRCPHLGCALKWNKYEHSWDCPCHGSRFSDDGDNLENPANDKLFY